MKYPYIVKKNGVWYPSGTEVPEGVDFVVDGEVIGKVDGDVISVTNEDVIKETLEEIRAEAKPYTKTDINRMSTAELRQMALNTDVEGADTMTGAELKKYLIDVFGL